MIRYVLAALLALAMLVLAVPAIDHAATLNTERQVDGSIAAIDDAASSLATNGEVSPEGHPDPQRVVDVTLPNPSLTTKAVDQFEIVPHEDGDYSHVRYVLDDGTTREDVVDERIVWKNAAGNASVELGGTGEQPLALVLKADGDGEPAVVARRA